MYSGAYGLYETRGALITQRLTMVVVLYQVEKALMLETDVPETINEALQCVRKMGR